MDMRGIDIKIRAKFGSKFQEQFARDSLMAILKSWRHFLNNANKKTDIMIEIDGSEIRHLDWFNFTKKSN